MNELPHKVHICVDIDAAIEHIKKGKPNFSNVSPGEFLKALKAQKKKGKRWFTGCDNEDDEGQCKGHEIT